MNDAPTFTGRVTIGVGDGHGQLFVEGDYESIKVLQQKLIDYGELRNKFELLTQEIANAAYKAGIYNGVTPITGPHLLMFLDDMAEMILRNSTDQQ